MCTKITVNREANLKYVFMVLRSTLLVRKSIRSSRRSLYSTNIYNFFVIFRLVIAMVLLQFRAVIVSHVYYVESRPLSHLPFVKRVELRCVTVVCVIAAKQTQTHIHKSTTKRIAYTFVLLSAQPCMQICSQHTYTTIYCVCLCTRRTLRLKYPWNARRNLRALVEGHETHIQTLENIHA